MVEFTTSVGHVGDPNDSTKRTRLAIDIHDTHRIGLTVGGWVEANHIGQLLGWSLNRHPW
jgi:hypothetical protein